MSSRTVLACSVWWFAACSAADKQVVEPAVGDGKGDVASRVDDQGALVPGDARTGSFTEDLQFYGFHLEVRAGAVVTIENTHRGTASRLDSTLFVYGPKTEAGFGGDAIAFDDDAGYGKHAKLGKLALVEGGEYLVVLGTADGRGRGAFRIEARCEQGECAPVAPPASGCDAGLADRIQHCVASQIGDTDLEADRTMSYAEAVEACTDGELLGRAVDEVCGGASPPAFCAGSFEQIFQTQGAACREELGARGGLCGAYLGDALALAAQGALFLSESDFPYEPVGFAGEGAPTAAKVLAVSGLAADSTVETRTFDELFAFRAREVEPDMDPFERDQLLRTRHLRRVLEGNLTDTLVVRIGEIQIQVFIVGRTACGDLAGVVTTSIET